MVGISLGIPLDSEILHAVADMLSDVNEQVIVPEFSEHRYVTNLRMDVIIDSFKVGEFVLVDGEWIGYRPNLEIAEWTE